MEILERDSQLHAAVFTHAVGRRHLEDNLRADKIAWILQHMVQRPLQMRIKLSWHRQVGSISVLEYLCVQ